MAQFSFDVVSKIDMMEVRNALDQARREISTRFDFKNTGTQVSHEGDVIEVLADAEGRLKAAVEVIKEKMVRRNVSLKALSEGPIQQAAKGNVKLEISLVVGITDEKARAINKAIKETGVKVQSQIQGDQIRVTSKSKNDLQSVIQALREADFEIPLQFINYR